MRMNPLTEKKSICVFCASSDAVDPDFFKVAEEVGAWIAKKKFTLVYGGGKVGLMGKVAEATHKNKGKVLGVIPRFMKKKEIAYEAADELIWTDDMRDRKTIMEENSDAFITLPGGFGTLEEVLEMLTLKQLHCHNKPIVFLNTNGFYDTLFDFFEQFYKKKFARHKHRKNYFIADTPQKAFKHIERILG